MRKLSMMVSGASVLALVTFASAPAGAIQIASGIGSADPHVSQVQFQDRGGRRGSGGEMRGRGRGGGGPGLRARSPRTQGGPAVSRSRSFSGGEARTSRETRSRSLRRSDRPRVSRETRSRSLRRSDGARVSRDFNRSRRFEGRRDRAWRGRLVRRGWSRDRRHVFYGAVLVGVPFGYAAIASHPCYDWRLGPRGLGYYWNYYRCPV